jgi:hypothetical protein
MKLILGILAVTVIGLNFQAAIAAEPLICPSPETGRMAFASGEAKSWPNYSEGTAARVQRQHPDTGLWAQAKFIGWNADKVALCQYYSHVGLLMTVAYVGYDIAEVVDGAYWREEFVEGSEDLDRPGREMLQVCMKKEDSVAYPSTDCRFKSVRAE